MSVTFTNNFGEARNSFSSALNRAMEAVGVTAEGYAKEEAPVDTGELRNSISHATMDNHAVAIGTNVEYGIYQEMGTYKMAPHPFIKPAVADHTEEYKSIVEAAMKAG